ncbi:hypothetical protein SAMN05444673_3411 [Bacillus sp. OV166]|uniref:hypothetical protein n=1 Tax=Bacillus sp. OV166 TaxID=1882763 RepID=UPI000A2AC2B2|nr:hypothetical protein [Bacillus sp. OV166]SMQ78402.1 hypothetical protein SAMN05444673_3411 [Bacillus sp. OV166]
MERIRPTLQNKTEIPVNIYKGEKLLIECPSIQQAARLFKKHTGADRFNWSAINKGIWVNEPYAFIGASYFFLTDPEAVKKK